MVFLRPELGNAKYSGRPFLFAFHIKTDGSDDLVDSAGGEDDGDAVHLKPLDAGLPEAANVGGGP